MCVRGGGVLEGRLVETITPSAPGTTADDHTHTLVVQHAEHNGTKMTTMFCQNPNLCDVKLVNQSIHRLIKRRPF